MTLLPATAPFGADWAVGVGEDGEDAASVTPAAGGVVARVSVVPPPLLSPLPAAAPARLFG